MRCEPGGVGVGGHVDAGHRVRCPAVMVIKVVSIRTVVDLPAPFGPRKPNTSPGRTSRSTPRTASTSPPEPLYVFTSPTARTALGLVPPGWGWSVLVRSVLVIDSIPGGWMVGQGVTWRVGARRSPS